MIGKGVRERSQRRQREHSFPHPLSPCFLIWPWFGFHVAVSIACATNRTKLLVVYLWNSANIILVLGPYLCIRIWGTDPPPPPPPLIFRPKWGPKEFFMETGHPPYLRVWDLMSPLGSQHNDLIGVASQALLIGVSWHLRKQCGYYSY